MRIKLNFIDYEEARLIEKAISGNKQSFGRLYDKYYQNILGYLFIRLNNKEDAEDMTEVVFLKVWDHIPEFGKRNRGKNFRAWLYRIAHNTVVDHYRTRKNTESLDFEQRSLEPQPETLLIKSEEKGKIVHAIQQLDRSAQNVIACRFFGGLSSKETALSMKLSENNVRVIQYRALKKIRELLMENDEYKEKC